MKENINPVTSDIPEDRFERIRTTMTKVMSIIDLRELYNNQMFP